MKMLRKIEENLTCQCGGRLECVVAKLVSVLVVTSLLMAIFKIHTDDKAEKREEQK